MPNHPVTLPPRSRLKLTKAVVAALPVPDRSPAIYWDTTLPGFGIRISPQGRRVYFLAGRTRDGRGCTLTCGRHPDNTPEQARELARKFRAQLALGQDPAAELKTRRQTQRARKLAAAEPTLAVLWQAFSREHIDHLRPKSARAYSAWWRNHIAPALGTLKLSALTRGRIEWLLRFVAENSGQSTSNRCHSLLSSMLSWGEGAVDAKGERRFPTATNVARGIKLYREPPRERDLTEVELAKLVAYLAGSSDLEARLLELALATGARKGELLSLRWQDISGPWWTIPASISKTKKRQRKPLSPVALAVLAKLDQRGGRLGASGDVVSPRFEGPFISLTDSKLACWWHRATNDIGLEDVRVHDLRHVAASLALNAGIPLAAVSGLLGHGVHSAAMTARYSHLSDQMLAEAAAQIGERLKLLQGPPAGNA